MSQLRALSLLCSVPLLAMCLIAARAAEPDALPPLDKEPVQAIWKPQELTFYYQSFTTFYSCSSLEAKVKRLLIAVGADRKMKIRTRGCMSSNEIARMPYVEITLASPVLATPETLAEFDKTRSTRELVARVKGDSKQAELAEAPFAAQWQRVSLKRGKLNLEPGDCELIDQLKKKVFPQLAIKIVEDRVECMPGQISITQPHLVIDVLTAMPKADEAVPKKDKT